MRVAVAVTEYPAASQTFVLDHVAALLDAGHRVDVCRGWSGKNARIAGPAGARVFGGDERAVRGRAALLAAAWRAGGWRGLVQLRGLSRRVGAAGLPRDQRRARLLPALPWLGSQHDIVHAHFGNRALDLLPMYGQGLLRAPLVVTFHGYDLQGYLQTRSPDVYLPLWQRATSLIATGPYMRELLVALGAPPAKIVTVPNGVRTDRIAFRPPAPPAAGEPLEVLTVARLVEKKGLAHGLTAVAALMREGLPIRYTIVGDGPLRDELVRQAAAEGIAEHVVFTGALPHGEVLARIASAQVFLSPGIVASTGDVETQGVALLEAMASGIPVVATAVGGVVHTVPAGAGRLVPPADAPAIAAAVRALAAQPGQWSAFGKAGREHVEREYDQVRNFTRLFAHYRDIA